MDDDYRELFYMMGGAVLLVTVIVAVGIWLESMSCHARFEGSNLETRWGIISGCQVNAPGQGWIPAENYRVL